MRKIEFTLIVICLNFFMHGVIAQDRSNFKFGKITAADFDVTADQFDSGANALVIADIGNTSFEGNDKGFFNIVFTRFLRVRIVNKNGFDIGSQQIYLRTDTGGLNEKIVSLRGSTFNLENGVITETKLDEKSVYKEKYNKNYEIRKISMPALKEGAIFDLVYTTKSPHATQIESWLFQGKYPVLTSDYEVTIPSVFRFVVKTQGDEHFELKKVKEIPVIYSIRGQHGLVQTAGASLNTNATDIHWIKKNVPSLQREPFITTLDNYYSKVSFQLNSFQWSNEDEKFEYMTDWKSMSKTLLEDEWTGMILTTENNWMLDELKTAIGPSRTDEEEFHKIYNYIRDNFRIIDREGFSRNSLHVHGSSLKDVYKRKEGNVAEINLLLVAMLRKAGYHADPLILSTRDHGTANVDYPLIDDYNYVICILSFHDKVVTLDASVPFNGFGQLPIVCYNGWGHLINLENPLPMNFSADSLHESSVTSVLLVNDDNGKPSGTYKSVLGKNASDNVRSEIIETSIKAFEKKTQTESGSDIVLENFGIDSVRQFDFPVTISYDFTMKSLSEGDLLYFDPVIGSLDRTNPFKSIDRHYPVEMSYQTDEKYLLNMDIPAGYQVDELPKSVRVNYNGNEGLFEYIIQKGTTTLQLSIRLKLNKAFFPTEEYATLRDFFSNVVKKENEKIVFKKIHQ